MIQIDTRGLSCPQPVVLVLSEIKTGKSGFEILLDSEASLENVKRLLNKNKLEFDIKKESDYTVYHVKR